MNYTRAPIVYGYALNVFVCGEKTRFQTKIEKKKRWNLFGNFSTSPCVIALWWSGGGDGAAKMVVATPKIHKSFSWKDELIASVRWMTANFDIFSHSHSPKWWMEWMNVCNNWNGGWGERDGVCARCERLAQNTCIHSNWKHQNGCLVG